MMRRNQRKKAENTQNQNASPSTGDHSSSSTGEQGLMENECIPLTDNLERNISELMELKNTIQELQEVCTGLNTRIVQAEERISEVEVQLNEIK